MRLEERDDLRQMAKGNVWQLRARLLAYLDKVQLDDLV